MLIDGPYASAQSLRLIKKKKKRVDEREWVNEGKRETFNFQGDIFIMD